MEARWPGGGLSSLQQFVGTRAVPPPGEACEFCGAVLAEEHGHVVDLEGRGMMCACRACYLLFTSRGAGKGRYLSIPDRFVRLPDSAVDRAQWLAWQIPVDMAFIFENSALERAVAFYPSPAGAIESTLPLDALEAVIGTHPGLADMEADVEALLVRFDGESSECFVVPIDRCYQLIGELRLLWQGFDGGEEVRGRIETFFAWLRSMSRSGT